MAFVPKSRDAAVFFCLLSRAASGGLREECAVAGIWNRDEYG